MEFGNCFNEGKSRKKDSCFLKMHLFNIYFTVLVFNNNYDKSSKQLVSEIKFFIKVFFFIKAFFERVCILVVTIEFVTDLINYYYKLFILASGFYLITF